MGKKVECRQSGWLHRSAYALCTAVIVLGLAGTAHAEETTVTHVYDGEQWVPFADGMVVGMPLFKGVTDYDSDSNVDCTVVEALCKYQSGSGSNGSRSIDLVISSEGPFMPLGSMDVVFYRIDKSGAFSPHEVAESDGNPSFVPLTPCSTYFIYDFEGTYHDRTREGAFSISDTRLLGSFQFDPYSIMPENRTSRNLVQEVSYFWEPSTPQYRVGHVPDWVQGLASWYDVGLVTEPEYAAALQFLVKSDVIEIPDSRVAWLCNHIDEDFDVHYEQDRNPSFTIDAIRDAASKYQCDKMWTVSPEGDLGCMHWLIAIRMENHGWQALDEYPEIAMENFLDIKSNTPDMSTGRDGDSSHLTMALRILEVTPVGQKTTVILDVNASDTAPLVSTVFQFRFIGDVEIISSDPPLRRYDSSTFYTQPIMILPGESLQYTVIILPVREDSVHISASGHDEHGYGGYTFPHDELYLSFGNQTSGYQMNKDSYTLDPNTKYMWTERVHPQCWSTPWFDNGQTVQDYYHHLGIEVLDTKHLGPPAQLVCGGCRCMGGTILFLTPASDYDAIPAFGIFNGYTVR